MNYTDFFDEDGYIELNIEQLKALASIGIYPTRPDSKVKISELVDSLIGVASVSAYEANENDNKLPHMSLTFAVNLLVGKLKSSHFLVYLYESAKLIKED